MVKPKKKCVITHESTFSVTGFLTFTVVSATAVANVIANINNNNDNNNNNNNQDNVNNNNQVSNSDDAENQGNARAFPHEKTKANAIANINNDNNYNNQNNINNNIVVVNKVAPLRGPSVAVGDLSAWNFGATMGVFGPRAPLG